MYLIYNNTESKCIYVSNNDQNFISYASLIAFENGDYGFSILGVSDAQEYLEEYCSNISLVTPCNSNLAADVPRLLTYDEYCSTDITTDWDEKIGYILDVKDNAYFYANEEDRDNDDRFITCLLESKFIY